MGQNYYLFTNMLSDEETRVVTSIIRYIESGEGRVGIQQIAAENYVSSTFIIKMCKRLGFDGYSELYYYLSQRVKENSQKSGASRLESLIDNYTPELADRFCQFLDQFQDRKIFADGKGFSDLVADYMVERLAVCGFMVFNRVHFYDFMVFHGDRSQLRTNIQPSLMIAISQSGETTPLIQDVQTARQNGYNIISFIRRPDSTLARLSDLVFIVDEEKQSLVGGLPNPFFGDVILAFEELMGYYFHRSTKEKK